MWNKNFQYYSEVKMNTVALQIKSFRDAFAFTKHKEHLDPVCTSLQLELKANFQIQQLLQVIFFTVR